MLKRQAAARAGDSVTCHKCGHACTVKTAVETALASGAVKKLSDHRVVHGHRARESVTRRR
jgi:uncharacterized Zn-binding protein involved in type VI secretion